MKLRVSVGLLEEFKVFSSNVFVLNAGTVDKLLRLHFLRSSQYVVCTAASAANLSTRAERDIGSIRKGLMESALDSHSVLRLLACECSPCKSCHKFTGLSGDSDSAVQCSTGPLLGGPGSAIPGALSATALEQAFHATDHGSCRSSQGLQGYGAPQLQHQCDAVLQGESADDVSTRQLSEQANNMLTQLDNMSISTGTCLLYTSPSPRD